MPKHGRHLSKGELLVQGFLSGCPPPSLVSRLGLSPNLLISSSLCFPCRFYIPSISSDAGSSCTAFRVNADRRQCRSGIRLKLGWTLLNLACARLCSGSRGGRALSRRRRFPGREQVSIRP